MSIASIILSVHPGLWWPIRHRERFHSKAVDNSINLIRPTTMKLRIDEPGERVREMDGIL